MIYITRKVRAILTILLYYVFRRSNKFWFAQQLCLGLEQSFNNKLLALSRYNFYILLPRLGGPSKKYHQSWRQHRYMQNVDWVMEWVIPLRLRPAVLKIVTTGFTPLLHKSGHPTQTILMCILGYFKKFSMQKKSSFFFVGALVEKQQNPKIVNNLLNSSCPVCVAFDSPHLWKIPRQKLFQVNIEQSRDCERPLMTPGWNKTPTLVTDFFTAP